MTCGLVVLASTLTVMPAASASPDATASATQVVRASTVSTPSQAPGFDECEASGTTAVETSLGSGLGAGASELLTASTRETINSSLLAAGRAPLNDATQAIRYLDDGSIYEVNARGAAVSQLSSSTLVTIKKDSTASTQALLHPEVKRIIGACLGFGGAGGMGFEALVRYLANPVNAVKFVIRRIGIAGAISCVGGVIWLYI
ncbi:hypothetical protein GM708_05020 [Vibrio cholerae]|nr:hypothetical protein [Vibrio cholerae]